MFDDNILGLSSLAKSTLVRSRCYLGNDTPKEVIQYLEDSYFGGRLELAAPGNHENVHWYDFKLMYGSILPEELPFKLKWAEAPELIKPGFYEVSFESTTESLACRLPIRDRIGPQSNKGYVRYASAGRGIYWYEELAFFKSIGGKVSEVIRGLEVTEQSCFFKDASTALIEDRENGCRFAKLALNTAYGRLAVAYTTEPDFLVTRPEAEILSRLNPGTPSLR